MAIGKTMNIGAHVVPTENNVADLGTENKKWRKIYGDVVGTATNITGTLAVAHGGTGVTSAEDIFATYGIEYIVGTQTAKTGSWTGVTKSSQLYVGKTIAYKLPFAGDGNATLSLTLPDGTATTAAPVYAGNTRLTTHYPVNSIMIMVWNGTEWRTNPYYNTNTNTLLRTYASSTDINVPLLGQSSAASTTATWSSYGTATYKDWYGVLPSDDAKKATINLSTGAITVPGGIIGNVTGNITGTAANVTGTVAIAHGGTGQTTAADAWTALGGGASGKHADSYFALASHSHTVADLPTASTAAKGIVQLSDATNGTNSSIAATEKAVASAYSLANAAIPKPSSPTAGDILYYNSGNWTALAKGSDGQVLKSTSSGIGWANDSAGANYLPLLGGTLTGVLTMQGVNIELATSDPTSQASPELVWKYAAGNIKAKLGVGEVSISKVGPTYTLYNINGSSEPLYSGVLPLGDGTGASGTWGISITGSSASCTGTAKNASALAPLATSSYTTADDVWAAAITATSSYSNCGLTIAKVATGATPANNDGLILTANLSSSWGYQIWGDDGSGQGGLMVRHRKSATEWNGWRTIVTVGADGTRTAGSATLPVYIGTNGQATAINTTGVGISITGSSASCTGNAATATTASYLTTPNVGGYSTDQYGNITHQRTTNTDYFQMKSNDGTARLKLYMETGQTDINQGYLNIFPNSGSFTEGIRIHTYSSWATIILCGADNTGNSGTSANSWSIHNNAGNFYITRNGSSSSSSAILKCVSNAWSCNGTFTASAFTASAGLLKITNNSNTTTIGSQNASFCHIYNSADIPFIFNNNVLTTKGSLGNATYPFANLYLKGNGNGIYYVGTKNTYRMIRFIDNTSDTYGNGISIGGGGQVIIGGGESADVAVAQAGTSGAESMWICNDGQIDLYANLQNGWNTNAHAYLNTSGYWYAVRCYNAVWNDYAECRNSNCTEPGYVVYENGDDTLSKTQIRMSHFAGIISDTFGTCMGETDDAKTPIAVAGRVLAYTYHPCDWYQPGDCVCAAPGGTVDIMTRDEVAMYPDRIVGTVSCVPDYDTWGTENVPVNGRIWIKVR